MVQREDIPDAPVPGMSGRCRRSATRRSPGSSLNLPNLITLARLLAVPLAVWLILDERYALAFWVFVGAGISDALDGYIAKRFDSRTRLGALLDPAADKALLAGVYVTLAIAGQLPDWLVFLVVFRDVLIIGGFVADPVDRRADTVRPALYQQDQYAGADHADRLRAGPARARCRGRAGDRAARRAGGGDDGAVRPRPTWSRWARILARSEQAW